MSHQYVIEFLTFNLDFTVSTGSCQIILFLSQALERENFPALTMGLQVARSVLYFLLRVEKALNTDPNLRYFDDPVTTPDRSKRDSIGPAISLARVEDSIIAQEISNETAASVRILITFFIYMASQSLYYLFHAFRIDEDHQLFQSTWALEAINLAMLFTIPMSAPLHRMLGFSSPQTPQMTLLARLDDLENDLDSRRLIGTFIMLIVCYSIGDFAYWAPRMTSLLDRALYPIAILLNIGSIYTTLLWCTLVARIALMRLHVIEREVDEAVDNYVTSSYESLNTSSHLQEIPENQAVKDLCERWLQGYRSTRHDLHHLGKSFGRRFLVISFLWIVEVSSMVLVIFDEMSARMTVKQISLFLLIWCANCLAIILVLFNMAYIHTLCSHHIGPKLSMLAMRHAQYPEYSALASTFLLAPIRLHVGNFEVGSEYANAITLWLFSLLLLIFGLKGPGAE